MGTPDRDQVERTIKNLENVLKMSKDQIQRQRVFKDIQRWKEILETLPKKQVKELDSYDEEKSASALADYELLKYITVLQMNKKIDDKDLNEIFTFMKFFEDEYLGMLGEYHLKLDYNQSDLRNTFYPKLHDIHNALEHYANALIKFDDEYNPVDKTRLKMMVQEEYRNLLKKVGDFLRRLSNFINDLVYDYEQSGSVIKNPHEKLRFSSGGNVLNGYTVIEGLKDLQLFLAELLDYLNIPEMG